MRIDAGSLFNRRTVMLAIITISTILGTAGYRETFVFFDFITPGDEAAEFLNSGKFPEKSCISSLGSYIPPGTSWLAIPGIALHRPLFLQVPAGATLFILALVGMYLLGKECAGPWTGCAAAALFGFSRSGMYWAQTFWPRAYPTCYVWIALFTVWWLTRRRRRYLFGALLVLLLGLSCHLELIYATIPIGLAWLWRRPPSGIWPILAAIACSLFVWFPYFRFESTRHFIDLRSQLLVHELPIRTLPQFDEKNAPVGEIEQVNRQTHAIEPFIPSRAPHPLPPWKLLSFGKNTLLSAFVNFQKPWLLATTFLAILLTILATCGVAFKCGWRKWVGDRETAVIVLCVSVMVPWLLLAVTAPPWIPYRQWGLWPLQCIAACVGVSFLLSLPRGQWVALLLICLWSISDAGAAGSVALSISKNGWAGAECAEAKICDTIARDHPPRQAQIGYFLFFPGAETDRDPSETTQTIGVVFDRYLRWRYGIENEMISVKGYAENDQYRILQTMPDKYSAYRFKPQLTDFTLIQKVGEFELWKRRAT